MSCGNVEKPVSLNPTLANNFHKGCGKAVKNPQFPVPFAAGPEFSTVSTGPISMTLWKLLKTLFKYSIQITYLKTTVWKTFC